MVRDDQTKVKIGDKTVDANITGIEIDRGDKTYYSTGRVEEEDTEISFSIEIEEVSEELENWFIYGTPDPGKTETVEVQGIDGGEIEEIEVPASVGFNPDKVTGEPHGQSWICDSMEDPECDELFPTEEAMEQHKLLEHGDKFRRMLRKNKDLVLEIVEDEFGAKPPEEKSIGEEVRDKVLDNIDHYQDLHDSDPTTNEVADKIGEPLNRTSSWLKIMEAQGVLESYKLGASDLWRRAD